MESSLGEGNRNSSQVPEKIKKMGKVALSIFTMGIILFSIGLIMICVAMVLYSNYNHIGEVNFVTFLVVWSVIFIFVSLPIILMGIIKYKFYTSDGLYDHELAGFTDVMHIH